MTDPEVGREVVPEVAPEVCAIILHQVPRLLPLAGIITHHHNHTEQGVQPLLGFLRKFSTDGRFLLAFSNDQKNVLIYDYRGASAAQSLYVEGHCKEEVKTPLFDRVFKLHFSVPVAENGEYLNRQCSPFTEDCQCMIVVSSATIPEELHPSMLES